MSSNLPRYRQRRPGGVHPLVKAGVVVLLPLLAIAGLVMAITDGAPTVTARAEGGSRLPDFATPGTSSTSAPSGSPSDTPTAPGETPSPDDSEAPSPDESGDSSDGSGGGSDEATENDELVATSPPREPGSRPTTPGQPTEEPSDDPSDPSEPSEPEPTEDPEPEPSEPSEPEPTEDPEPDFPDLPIIELSNAEAQLVEVVDEARAEAGCPALRVDSRLTIASREHSEDMRDRDYYAHVSPDGEGPADRAADEGYTAPVGENLSRDSSAQQVVRDWEDDGDERDRLLDCSYTSVGVGAERGGLLGLKSWWTLMLGTD